MADEPRFPGQRPEGWQPPASARQGFPGWLTGLLVLGGFVALASTGLLPLDVPKEPANSQANPVAPAMTATAAELWQAFDQNEVAAQARYGDRVLAVSGTVAGVDLDFMNEPVVKLETPNQFQSVQADFDDGDKAAVGALAKGQRVVVVCGKLSEVAGSPMLDDCRLGE